MKEKTLFQILAELDWIAVLKEAIESRSSSWNDKPVREWRNASDTIFSAIINELRRKGYIE